MAQIYESDITRMIRELLRDKPHIVQEQRWAPLSAPS